MAIDLTVQYPGKIGAATPAYPYGEPRNVTIPDDGTGTPWEQAIAKETEGFKQALLSAAGITPSGTPDAVAASQYLQSVIELISGRTIRYNETGIANAYIVEPVGNSQFAASLFIGLTVIFTPTVTNTGPSTLDYNGTLDNIFSKITGAALTGGEMAAGVEYKAQFDGTNWILIREHVNGKGALAFSVAAFPLSVPSGVFFIVQWDSDNFDTDNIHDTVTNTSRLTVPPGITKVKLNYMWSWGTGSTGNIRNSEILKNGLSFLGNGRVQTDPFTFALINYFGGHTPMLEVQPGDFFELQVNHDNGTNLGGDPGHCCFGMELIG